jgi:hypothetical protein
MAWRSKKSNGRREQKKLEEERNPAEIPYVRAESKAIACGVCAIILGYTTEKLDVKLLLRTDSAWTTGSSPVVTAIRSVILSASAASLEG